MSTASVRSESVRPSGRPENAGRPAPTRGCAAQSATVPSVSPEAKVCPSGANRARRPGGHDLEEHRLLVSGTVLLSLDNGPCFDRIPLWFVTTIVSRDVLLVIGTAVIHYSCGKIVVRPRLLGKPQISRRHIAATASSRPTASASA